MPLVPRHDEVSTETLLNIAVIGPDERRRMAVIDALTKHPGLQIQEYTAYPSNIDDLCESFRNTTEIVIVDVDSNPQYAFDLATALCADGQIYVMTYSAKANMQIAVQMMRAGVREFLTLPIDPAEFASALMRASARYSAPVVEDRSSSGKLSVFVGTKGGCGATTLAANFALAVTEEANSKTILIDLGQPLGDIAINLGITAEYSVATALQNPARLDANLLATLSVKHNSGLYVLAAHGDFTDVQPTKDGMDRLLTIALTHYDHVIVDAGFRLDLMDSKLFETNAIVYLVTQPGISDLRNANRMIFKYFYTRGQHLQIVLNRYKSSGMLVDEDKIEEVLSRAADWKIPEDLATVRRAQETATPLVSIDSLVSRSIREMARAAAGLDVETEKDEKRGLFRFLR
jgi:pilus assembly protein CpaE